jgi:hypothetical protein
MRHESNQTFRALNARRGRRIVFGNWPFSGYAADWNNFAQQRPVNCRSNQSKGRTGEDKDLRRRKCVKTVNEDRFQERRGQEDSRTAQKDCQKSRGFHESSLPQVTFAELLKEPS